MDFNKLKEKKQEDMEKELSFTHYLETKDFEDFKRIEVDHNLLVDAFLKFNNGSELKTVKLHDEVIQDFFTLSLGQIEKELRLLKDNKGIFCSSDDDELTTSFGFFNDNYMAEFMQEIIFFSGKEESVKRFSSVLDEFKINHFAPDIIPSLKNIKKEIKQRKLGRNEPCHCGSGIKYKKCCMDNDIKTNGRTKKVVEEELEEENDFWEDGYFAETLSSEDIKMKERTIHMKHDEEMNYNCKKCNCKISAHNKDWHAGMCDKCFNKEVYGGR